MKDGLTCVELLFPLACQGADYSRVALLKCSEPVNKEIKCIF